MIYKKLEQDFNAKRLYSSYLVSTDDIDFALTEIYKFLIEKVFRDDSVTNYDDLSNKYIHPDLFICGKEEVTSKNITVEQVRNLREFIHKSSIISGYKVGIITPADLMNDNAANSCLKMLEDTPSNSLIILLTTVPAGLLPTIRSRCSKIFYHTGDAEIVGADEYQRFLQIFAEGKVFEQKNSLIKEFANKDRSKWLSFAMKLEDLFAKFVKLRAGAVVDLIPYEREIYNRFKLQSNEDMLYEFRQLSVFIQSVVEYDLDLKLGTVILLDFFNKNNEENSPL